MTPAESPERTNDRVRVAAAVIWDQGRLLLTQRPPGGPHGLHWEFPGGKLEPGETPATAITRELHEELGVPATAHEILARERFDYRDGPRVEIAFVRCTLASHRFRPGPGVHALRWVRPADLDVGEVLEADRAFLRSLGAPS